MRDFNQAEAAFLSRYEERAFRVLVDKRIVLPTPATRVLSRGKPKLFDRHEVMVASVLNVIDMRLSSYQKAEVADWLRRNLNRMHTMSSNKNPVYVVLEGRGDGSWSGDFEFARGQYVPASGGRLEEDDQRRISVLDENREPRGAFVAANLQNCLNWTALNDDDLAGLVQAGLAAPETTA